MTKQDRIMRGAATYCAYYRSNPHRFVHDYLHIDLKLFQKIVLILMMLGTNVVFIGARGIGKTFLSAIFCVTRCILYPGTKICIASGTRGQGINVLEKILLELKPNSKELALEIDEKQNKLNGTEARVVFKNSSFIKVVTASESSRGNRATVLLIDEFRLVSKDIIDTILKKFLTQRRMPRYSELNKRDREKEYAKEKNMTLYLSSAYFKDHWSYTKCEDTCKSMLDENKKQFIVGLPYQLSIEEGLLDPDLIEDEMSETDFSEVKFSMEYEAKFFGSSEGAFFDFDSISKNRKIKYPMLPEKLANKLNNASQVKIIPKQPGEIRILSVDIALMSSKKNHNDATAIFINSMTPTKSGKYLKNFIYTQNNEGLRTDDQALIIRKLYEEFLCDYIVIDAQGIGLGCVDLLMKDMVDQDSGEIYPALSCCNNSEMASRCASPNAPKVIWAIKANAVFNSECAYLLREGFRSGQIRLLVTEFDADEILSDIKGFNSLNPYEKTMIELPYINTTLLVDELINLQHEEVGGKIKVYEKSGMRKDRYSSLAYNYYVSLQIESKINKKKANSGVVNEFVCKPPIYKAKKERR